MYELRRTLVVVSHHCEYRVVQCHLKLIVNCSCSASDVVQLYDPFPQAYLSTMLSKVLFDSINVLDVFAGIL